MIRVSFGGILLNSALVALPLLLGFGAGHAAGVQHSLTYPALSFPSARLGWVLAARGTTVTVLRTSDGGRSWTSVAHLPQPLVALSMQFVDVRHGWISGLGPPICGGFKSPPCHTILLRTVDGGQRWTHLTTPSIFGAPGDVRFVDSLHGWLIHAQSPCKSFCLRSLYATSNGGLTWHPVRNAPRMPVMGLSSVDARHVWIGGGYGPSCVVSIYGTSDGGVTWTRQFEVPKHCGLVQVGMLDARRGWAVEGGDSRYCSMGGCSDYALYETTDGGKHWRLKLTPARPWWNTIASYGGDPGAPVFVTARYGWIPFGTGAGSGAGGIAISSDGGHAWRRVLGPYSLSESDIALISREDGWVSGVGRHCASPSCNGDLLHTDDSGTTWTKLHPQP